MTDVVHVSVRNAFTGSHVVDARVDRNARVSVLRHAVWQAMVTPTHRLTAKSRTLISGTLMLAKEHNILQDDRALSDYGFTHDCVANVLVSFSAAPCQVTIWKSRRELIHRAAEWLGLFASDETLGTLGSQRVESIEGDPRHHDIWLDDPRLQPKHSECYSFVQVQTQFPLEAPRRFISTRTKRRVDMAFLKPDMQPERLRQVFADIASSILLGGRPPKHTSMLAIFKQEPMGSWGCVDSSLLAVVRDTRGFSAMRCCTTHGEEDYANAALRRGYRPEQFRKLAEELQQRCQCPFDDTFDWLEKQLFPFRKCKRRLAPELAEDFWASEPADDVRLFDVDPENLRNKRRRS